MTPPYLEPLTVRELSAPVIPEPPARPSPLGPIANAPASARGPRFVSRGQEDRAGLSR